MQDALTTRVANNATKAMRSTFYPSIPVGLWVRYRRQLPVAFLLLSDILLALVMWLAAVVFQDALGRGPLSDVAAASIVPNVVAWWGCARRWVCTQVTG